MKLNLALTRRGNKTAWSAVGVFPSVLDRAIYLIDKQKYLTSSGGSAISEAADADGPRSSVKCRIRRRLGNRLLQSSGVDIASGPPSRAERSGSGTSSTGIWAIHVQGATGGGGVALASPLGFVSKLSLQCCCSSPKRARSLGGARSGDFVSMSTCTSSRVLDP